MYRIVLCGLILTLGCLLSGCSDSGLYNVTGTVNFDGKPIEKGRILFRRLDGDKRAFAGTISNGQYSLQSEAGKMRVEITASRIIPGKFDTSNGTKEPVGQMYIPAKYNSHSELAVEVSSSQLVHSFDLKSK